MLNLWHENVRRGWYKKSFLTQYYRHDCHKKNFFAENDSWGNYVGISFYIIWYWGWHKKVISTENVTRDWYIKPPLSQYVRQG